MQKGGRGEHTCSLTLGKEVERIVGVGCCGGRWLQQLKPDAAGSSHVGHPSLQLFFPIHLGVKA